MFYLKRAYEPPIPEDGQRILVERLWPRGLTKSAADIDRWMKELAPSAQLRKWFAHDPEKWTEFQHRYERELAAQSEALGELRAAGHKGRVTLIYAARDKTHNGALALKSVLEKKAPVGDLKASKRGSQTSKNNPRFTEDASRSSPAASVKRSRKNRS